MNRPLYLIIAILSIMLVYSHRSKFYSAISSKQSDLTTETELLHFNDAPLPDFIDIRSGVDSSSLRILILGNSISAHPISTAVGWGKLSGMAASSPESDYVHLLWKDLKKVTDRKINFKVSNISKWERWLEIDSIPSIDSLKKFNPHIVIFQVGDNVPESISDKFEQSLEYLYEQFPNSKSIFTVPYYGNKVKNEASISLAKKHNSMLVDLSGLSAIDVNRAMNDPALDSLKHQWHVSAVGTHPGDAGMRAIADRYLITIKSSL